MALEENQFEIAKILSKEMTKHFDKSMSMIPKQAPKPLVPVVKFIRPPIRAQNSNECIICFGLKNGIFAFQPTVAWFSIEGVYKIRWS